jgi:hypothetical protein
MATSGIAREWQESCVTNRSRVAALVGVTSEGPGARAMI